MGLDLRFMTSLIKSFLIQIYCWQYLGEAFEVISIQGKAAPALVTGATGRL
ncbi:hypothetical protein [Aliikangiella sp. G2MR2-5]|uniref:hypothetical protein n=1 Tax=Aliikangiella sp. G2MR2-5 TaxID=2788943 RepID=UPI0018A92BFD|nr:hypothetical protein [Aliikangiella sp. G2MR2-5]